MRYFFIVNPEAGKNRSGRIWPRLRDRLESERIEFGYALTSEPGEATHMTRDVVRAGYDAVVGVGGDGTLNEIVAGLSPETALGVIPAGTGNDFAHHLAIPKQPDRALDVLLQSQPIRIDRGRANGLPFLNIAGIGFDAMVAKRVKEQPTRGGGTIPYLASVLHLLMTYRNASLSIEIDGRTIETTSLLVAVGNGAYVGGGMRICPQADLNDGRFDICIVGDLKRTEALYHLPTIFRGTHITHRKVIYMKAQNIRIEGPNVPYHKDGEPSGSTPVEFEIEPQAITLLAPPNLKTART